MLRTLSLVAITVSTTACFSTRQLASSPSDALHTANHTAGWVVPTTEPWRERIDPLTTLQFHRADGKWSEVIHANDLHVDREGAWIDDHRAIGHVAESIRIEDVAANVGAIIEDHQPKQASVREIDADDTHLTHRYVITASHADLQAWVDAIELDVARLDPIESVEIDRMNPTKPTTTLVGDRAKLHQLRTVDAAPLGHWFLYAEARGWYRDLRGTALLDAIETGLDARLGWRWAEMDRVDVTNISGGKTFGAMIGYTAAAIVLAPVALLARGGFPGSNGSGASAAGNTLDAADHVASSAGDGSTAHDTEWLPSLTPESSLHAGPLFTRGARYRAYVQPTLSLDTTVGYRGDLLGAGAVAKIRVGQIWEIGGGVREVASRSAGEWSHSTTGVFATGVHLPLDAGMKFALPVGIEVSGGGQVGVDFRIPWGLRYNRDHYFVTASPATPAYLHLHDAPRRWSFASSVEVGYAF